MKLLASLIGCAVADYACCPYDDFGVVNAACPLSEKTPWAMKDANVNGDPMGVEHHLCKAWEANIDATMEGNEDKDNWGGCGFQRHFPWSTPNSKQGATILANTEQCNMGMFNCAASTTVVTNNYKTLNVGGMKINLDAGTFAHGGENQVLGQVTLGGVCKLFIPVTAGSIDSVHIAGVHMSGGAASGGLSARLCNNADCDGTATTGVDGTAYCFSVVNIGEWMENHMPGSNFNVMNGNVAGKDVGGHDPFLLEGPTSEGTFAQNFGDSITPAAAAGGTDTIVEAGASFDVVVHFKSEWCIRHWSIIDMQTSPDWHSGADTLDYPLADVLAVPQHAHTDVADKRFMAGLCGCCKADGTKHDANALAISADGCLKCQDVTAITAECSEFNTYEALAINANADFKWPNAGAWAAYYSFITCANSEFMVYDSFTSIDANGVITAAAEDRTVVHSMFYNDIRHDHSNAHGATGSVVIRGNIRQVGEQVKYCGPGEIPANSATERCTWNWNFMVGTNDLAEEWFSRTNPSHVNVWNSATGQAILREDGANIFSPALIDPVVKKVDFTVTLKADANVDTASVKTFTLDADKYFTTPAFDGGSSASAGHIYTFTMQCLQSSLDGTGTPIADAGNLSDLGTGLSRDMFPDCYMGDEIHFNFVSTGGSTAGGDHRISAWYSLSSATF
jgi:hypothetical protein